MENLSQRYISNELTHFVGRGLSTEVQFSVLSEILNSGFLSHPPHNRKVEGNLLGDPSAKLSQNQMYLPQVVCFCDIPLQDLPLHIQKYSPFGLSFKKDFIVRHGGAPVFYVPLASRVKTAWEFPPEVIEEARGLDDFMDRTSGMTKADYFDWMVSYQDKALDQIEEKLLAEGISHLSYEFRIFLEFRRFLGFHIFGHTKFFDHSLPDNHPDNYYFEREWRILGNLRFTLNDVYIVILPKRFAKMLRDQIPAYCGQIVFADD